MPSSSLSLMIFLVCASSSSSIVQGYGIGGGQRCYICLPRDDTSLVHKEIVDMFKNDTVQSCDNFPDDPESSQLKNFEFTCPPNHGGCVLRVQGNSVSRSCARFILNDCKMANSVEVCFCSSPLCNFKSMKNSTYPQPKSLPISKITNSEEEAQEQLENDKDDAVQRGWSVGDTDDEDLLMQDEASGDGDFDHGELYPSGVVDLYTTTKKPALVPNLRADNRKTTPEPPPPPPSAGTSKIAMTNVVLGVAFLALFRSL